jgi:methionine synthase II (cobalamin-independent)
MNIKRKLLATIKESIALSDGAFVEAVKAVLREDKELDAIVQDAKTIARKARIKLKGIDTSDWEDTEEVVAEISIDPETDELASSAGKKILMVLSPGRSSFANALFLVGSKVVVRTMPGNKVDKKIIDTVANYITDKFA